MPIPYTEQAARRRSVRQNEPYIPVKLKPLTEILTWHHVRIDGADVLTANGGRYLMRTLKRQRTLAGIHRVVHQSVVNKEIDSPPDLHLHLKNRQIETEDLHLLDAFAPTPLDVDMVCITLVAHVYDQLAR
jgi:hypothetical protein